MWSEDKDHSKKHAHISGSGTKSDRARGDRKRSSLDTEDNGRLSC